MRIRRLARLLIAAALLTGLAGSATGAAGEAPALQVSLSESEGWIRAEWTRLDGDCVYEVTACDRMESTDGAVALSPVARLETAGASVALTDALAWYYQESGLDSERYPMELVVTVAALKDGQRVAEGESDALGLTDFFPPETAPAIGADIPPEAVTRFEWRSSGMYIEANFFFGVTFEGDDSRLEAHYHDSRGAHETDAAAPEALRRRLLDIICRGRLYRDYVMDPEIMVLDGGEQYFRVEWEGMKASERRFYRIGFDEADAEALDAELRGAAAG